MMQLVMNIILISVSYVQVFHLGQALPSVLSLPAVLGFL